MLRILLSLTLFAPILHAEDAPPNIIVVMPDDMGYGDLGATGNKVIRTPNLDQLAADAASLTNFYVSPVCSPTRASLMSGRYNYRTRVIDTFKGRSMMEPEEVTVAEALRDAGYATGIFGKWHLGDNYPLRPQDQGFDEVLVHRGGGLAQPSEPIENERRYTDPILFHNGEQVQMQGYCTDIYFDAAMDFIGESQKAKQPFFIYLPPNAPHGPYHDVPEDLLSYYKSVDLTPILAGNNSDQHKDTVARVFAMVENIDQNMGRLDAFLSEKGLIENTLVIFLTDNGPNTMRYVGPFRGMKSNVLEGGIHTCFYARWPKVLKAGTTSDRISAHIDIMPTLLEAAGVAAPENVKFDGVSVLPLLKGMGGHWDDERLLFFQSHRGDEPVEFHNFAVRSQQWKLLRNSGFGKENPDGEFPFELYRIPEDPREENDLAPNHPELVQRYRDEYRSWLLGVSSTRPDNYDPPRIIIGSDEETSTDLSIQDWRVDAQEGWGVNGRWMVDVVSPGPYKATVKWDHPIGERTVTLKAGEFSAEGQLDAGSQELSFPAIQLPEGQQAISVEISGDPGRKDMLRFLAIERE